MYSGYHCCKARKLEFLLAEAIKENCDCVVTCGGLQSNFGRTVAVACRQVGLECHLLLRCPGDKVLAQDLKNLSKFSNTGSLQSAV